METNELSTMGKGMAVRAGLLGAGALLIAGWGFALGAKVASAAIHFLLVLGVGLLGAGFITYKVKKFERSLQRPSIAA
ncbi:MAG: hypothetical protein JWO56_2495 [Acidobacteria bacterium]|nr:hypothetical protein [Acidobacteriota bacterium]